LATILLLRDPTWIHAAGDDTTRRQAKRRRPDDDDRFLTDEERAEILGVPSRPPTMLRA
jgi:hypothetical protein